MSKISYAVELSTDTTITNHTYALHNGVFRWVTGRPGYDGSAPYPKHEDTTDNLFTWFEGWITKDGVGNPQRNVNIEVSGEYGTLSGFNFSVRNDTMLWEYLATNGIYLTNREVALYTVIDDVFYRTWTGVVRDTVYNETHFKVTCIDTFKTVHKQLPPNLVSDPSSGTGNGEPVPVVFGDVPYSKITIDTSYETIYQNLWYDLGKNIYHTRTTARGGIAQISRDTQQFWFKNITADPVYTGYQRAIDVDVSDVATSVALNLNSDIEQEFGAWVTDNALDDLCVQIYESATYNYYEIGHDWTFSFWAKTNTVGITQSIKFKMYRYNTVTDTDTFFWESTPVLIDSTTPKKYTVTYTAPSPTVPPPQGVALLNRHESINTRYKYRVKFKAIGKSADARTVTMYYGGDYNTSVMTPCPRLAAASALSSNWMPIGSDPARDGLTEAGAWVASIQLWCPGTHVVTKNQFKGMYLFAVAGSGAQDDTGYRIVYNSGIFSYSMADGSVIRTFYVLLDRYIPGCFEADGMYSTTGQHLWVTGPSAIGLDDTITIFRIGDVKKIGVLSEGAVQEVAINPNTKMPYLYSYDAGTKSYLDVSTAVYKYDSSVSNEVGHPHIDILPNMINIIPLVPKIEYITVIGGNKDLQQWVQSDFDGIAGLRGQLPANPAPNQFTYGASNNTNGDTFKHITDLDKVTEFVVPAMTLPCKHITLKIKFSIHDYVDLFESLSNLQFGLDAYLYGVTDPVITGLSGPVPDGDVAWRVSRRFAIRDFYGNVINLDDSFYDSYRATATSENNPNLIATTCWRSVPHPRAITRLGSREWTGILQQLPNQYYLAGDDHGTDSAFSMFSNKWCVVPPDIFNFLKAGVCTAEVECYISFHIKNSGYWQTYTNAGTQLVIKQFGLLASKKTTMQQEALYCRVRGELTSGQETNTVYNTYRHILEGYDGIPTANIDYTNLPTTRHNWYSSRTINDRRSSYDYLNELCRQSFVCMVSSRTGKRRLVAWREYTNNPVTHDEYSILRGSIGSWAKSDLNNLHNMFNLKYSYNPASGIFDRCIYVDQVWQSSFPLPNMSATIGNPDVPPDYTGQWQSYCGGPDWLTYQDAKILWEVCRTSYLNHKTVTQALTPDLGELYWYDDRKIYDPTITTGVGTETAAYLYLKNLVEWTTRQKDIVTYSIPITTTNLALELLQPVIFNDDIYTNHLNRTGWITGIEVDTANDKINIETTLEPYNLVNVSDNDIIESGDRTDTYLESGAQTDTIGEGLQ